MFVGQSSREWRQGKRNPFDYHAYMSYSLSSLKVLEGFNRFPLIINDVPPPPSLIINIPGGQNIFIIRGEYLLKGFGRAAFKFLLKSIKIK